ncbi:MAG: pseudouridine synthase [Clostridia bacterium]
MVMRLDKYLALSGEHSRSDALHAVRGGLVRVNGEVAKRVDQPVSEDDEVLWAGERVVSSTYQYYILHKPEGVLTAARDRHAQTVMDLLPQALLKRNVLPVGRLDKDTTGLLLLTNDGALAHRLLSPKHHVWKQYLATVAGELDKKDVLAFSKGMTLSDFSAKPAVLRILSASEEQSQAQVELREGKFHQVKRMFAALGHEVLTLHRTAFGTLTLPSELAIGDYRALSKEEIAALKACAMEQKPSADSEAGEEGQDDA